MQSFFIFLWVFLAVPAFAANGTHHSSPVAQVVLSLAIVLIAAKLGGHLATRVGQPPVLGELILGVVIGNLTLVGFSGLDHLKDDLRVDMLAQIGAIILLFEVGLGSTLNQMLQVGLSSFLVATLGVIGPFVLGWGVGAWLLPESSVYVHVFLGATLTATSVGITARVLKDLGRSESREGRVILGAAVIDDVLGLLILAVVSGVIAAANSGTSLSYMEIGGTLLKACIFLVGSLTIGIRLSPHLFVLASKLRTPGVLLAVGLAFCFFLSWLADTIGLAPIVGAFAAGLILDDLPHREFMDSGETLKQLIKPIASFLVPVFFVFMGIRTDLRSFARPGILGLAGMLIVAAIIGKQFSCLGVVEKSMDRLSVGLGMIPRGEVGLILASIGLTLTVGGERVVNQNVFSAVVIMVIVTTLIAPLALKWSFGRSSRR